MLKTSQSFSLSDSRSSLANLHDAILSVVISNDLSKRNIEYGSKHIDDIIRAIRSPSAHISTDLHGCSLVCDRDTVYFENEKEGIDYSVPLNMGLNKLPDNRAIYVGNDEKDINTLKNIYKLSIQVTVSSAKISSDCFIRYRKHGDTIKQNGMTKKVKKLIQSLKLPSRYTDGIPFICSESQVLYIPHFRPSDLIKTDNNSDSIIDIYYFYDMEQ